jgi:hypothetical protein
VFDLSASRSPSQFEQSLALAYCDWTKLIRGSPMKALGIALGVLIALYFADQEFAQGQFTDAAQRIGVQMMHSFGI